jgi:hypothetical protein
MEITAASSAIIYSYSLEALMQAVATSKVEMG